MGKAQGLAFGDLVIDETCLFARRDGRKIQFTRTERALLLAFSRNPHRLMKRGSLVEAIAASGADTADRNIDFQVNRLRTKLGDNARSPKYIATQYGEGYVWIAAPARQADASPSETFLAIAPVFAENDDRSKKLASSLMGRLIDAIAAGLRAVPGRDRKVVVVDSSRHAAPDRPRYLLQVSFQAGQGRVDGAATLRDMPSARIVKAFRLDLGDAGAAALVREATRVSGGVVQIVRQALIEAATGLGTPMDLPLESRLHQASALLSSSQGKWLASGKQLARDRAQYPSDPDIALQWCQHLFARLVLADPESIDARQRDELESEIEALVLEALPVIETKPLLMLAAAKLLHFVHRGHLVLAEDLAERAAARTSDFAAALPVLGLLRLARGKSGEAIALFDRAIAMAAPDSGFLTYLRMLKCSALLASGDSAAMDSVPAIPAFVRVELSGVLRYAW